MKKKITQSIKTSRRGFLGALTAAPVVGPLAAKKLAEDEAKKLMEVKSVPYMAPSTSGVMSAISCQEQKTRQISLVTKLFKDEIMEMIRREQKLVLSLEHDLASNRSMSLAAKIYVQRQRNIQRRYDDLVAGDQMWDAVNSFLSKKLTEKSWMP